MWSIQLIWISTVQLIREDTYKDYRYVYACSYSIYLGIVFYVKVIGNISDDDLNNCLLFNMQKDELIFSHRTTTALLTTTGTGVSFKPMLTLYMYAEIVGPSKPCVVAKSPTTQYHTHNQQKGTLLSTCTQKTNCTNTPLQSPTDKPNPYNTYFRNLLWCCYQTGETKVRVWDIFKHNEKVQMG